MELLGVRMASEIEPELVVEADGVDHQRVAFPPTDRVTIPGGVRIFRVLAAVHEDLTEAMDVALEKEVEVSCLLVRRHLHDAPRVGRDTWDASRQAVRFRVVTRFPRVHDRLRCRQKRNRIAGCHALRKVSDWASTLPDASPID